MTTTTEVKLNDWVRLYCEGASVEGSIAHETEKAYLICFEALKKSNDTGFYRDIWVAKSQIGFFDSLELDPVRKQDGQVLHDGSIPAWLYFQIRKITQGY